MDEALFEKRLRCAAAAGWCTLLIGFILNTLSWIMLMVASLSPPVAGFLSTCWGGVRFDHMRLVWLATIVIVKMVLFVAFLSCILLSLWLRRLRKTEEEG